MINSGRRGESLEFSLDKEQSFEALGSPLVIKLGYTYHQGDQVEILIKFSTNTDSEATQWCTPEMTAGGKYPFMYTQGEAIHTRTLLPCQDTPAAKVSVKAALKVKKPLVALYAGIQTSIEEDGDSNIFHYEQKIPVATYLMAIAAGAIEGRKISSRTTVYAEKETVDAAAYEFGDTEKFIETAESYLTPYEWGQYNIIVLPPGFPYGGMENPTLTFATPSLIAGDRSLANVIAHEISHSWTGNLVTNRNWQSFWLNEGFTVFVERKIAELIYGDDMRKLSANIGYTDLMTDIQTFGESSNYTSLHPDIQHNDPDDAFSTVPYEKGFNFLYFLESITGKDQFRSILRSYIQKFRLQSIEYTDWQTHFTTQVNGLFDASTAQSILAKVDWDKWINQPGKPIVDNDFTNSYQTEAKARLDDLLNNKLTDDFPSVFKNWHTAVKTVFLNLVQENLGKVTDQTYDYLRDSLNLTSANFNMEIKNVWYQIALNLKKTDVVDHVVEFLGKIGRMKYIRPIYIAFGNLNKKQAYEVFTKYK